MKPQTMKVAIGTQNAVTIGKQALAQQTQKKPEERKEIKK